MTKQLWAATRALLVLTVILGVSYPLVITAVGRLMPGPAAGSIITVNGQPVGSALLGQAAPDPQWFQARPSVSDHSGETSGGGRSRIGAELERVRPDIVIIELGANDGLRGLPLQQLGANLGWMIGASKAAGARVLLVGMQLPPNFGRYASDFERSYLLISQRLQTGLLPRFLAPLGTERKWFQADNLHPVAEAQPLLAAQVLQALDGLPPPR